MNRKKTRGVRYTPGYRWDELEFYDDTQAIKKELAAFDAKARAKAIELGRIIEADFERERQALLAECMRKRAEDLLEIAALELEEKMKSAIEADRAESQRVFTAYAERLQKAFHAAAAEQAAWHAENKLILARIQGDINRSNLRAERNELLRRGVIKGRRR
jgi:hypothetical protein